MYPLKAVLIGKDESILPVVRRELSNQYVEIDQEFPDVSSTVESLSLHHEESRLFICQIDGEHQGDDLRRLSGAFAGRPIVVLLEGNLNSASIVHAMRDGAAQVVMLPLNLDDFREAITMVAMQFGRSLGKSRVIAVTGAHGGVGSTTLAINLAYELSQTYQTETILAELSFNCGVLSSYLAIKPQYDTLELLQFGQEMDVYTIKKAMVPFGDRLSILAGPSHAVKSSFVNQVAVSQMVNCLRQLAPVVILDVPSSLDETQLTALNAADEVVLVAEQTVPSLQMICEALRLGIRAHSPWVVINRFDAKVQGLDVNRIKQALSIDSLHTIKFDHEAVISSINCGQPLRLCVPKSEVLVGIDELAQDLLEVHLPAKATAGIGNLLSSLGHALGVC